MLTQRVLVATVIIPLLIVLDLLGAWAIDLAIVVGLGVAAWEYWRIFKVGGFTPSPLV